MANYIKIATVHDFSSDEIRGYRIKDRAIAVCRIKDEFFAFDEICSHEYASLTEGWLDEYTIECPMHGAKFDVRTGKPLTLPAIEAIVTYEIKIEGDTIFVKLG